MSSSAETPKKLVATIATEKTGGSVPEVVKPLFDFLDLRAQYASIREEVMAWSRASSDRSILFWGPK